MHRLTVDDALRSLGSRSSGLSTAEALLRLRTVGSNRVEHGIRTPWWRRLFGTFVEFFALVLWAAAGLAFIAEWLDPGQHSDRIGYAVVAVILISGGFTFWQEHRAERTLDELQKLLPQRVSAVRDGNVVELSTDQLVPGTSSCWSKATTFRPMHG